MTSYAEVFSITATDMGSTTGHALLPGGEYIWMIAVLVLGALALWQARTFVSQF